MSRLVVFLLTWWTCWQLDVGRTRIGFFFFSSRRRHTRFKCDWSSTCALPILSFERLTDVHSKDSIINPLLIERHYPTGSDGETAPEFTLDPAHFRRGFAADVPEERTRLMAAAQRPIAGAAFADTSGPVAWKTLPSWAIIPT